MKSKDSIAAKIGFMQGRLSPLVNAKIQAFPWQNWQKEFQEAHSLNFEIMEWTLDHENLYKNPLMTEEGREEIKKLSKKFKIRTPSLTGDCFMQAPFWKARDNNRKDLENDFLSVIESCGLLNIELIVIPLVDNGSIDNLNEMDSLIYFLQSKKDLFDSLSIQILFESDYGPVDLKNFIDKLDPKTFGINYDIGNSASLGFDPYEEFEAYGKRITNVHVKDRVLHGTTVPLGDGNANFEKVFQLLNDFSYKGNYILQTARSKTGDHLGVLQRYNNQVKYWLGL